MRYLKIAACLTTLSFVLASIAYLFLQAMIERPYAALFRMHLYHYSYPFQYIALVSLVYGFMGVLWFRAFGRLSSWKRYFSITVTVSFAMLLASIPGGVLWVVHDMQAGFVPSGTKFWNDLMNGVVMGMEYGWLIILLSFPLNIWGFVTGSYVLDQLCRRF